MNVSLWISGVSIRQDAAGRFCLNDFHRAAGGEQRHQPRYWLANQQTQELLAALGDSGNSLSVVRGGVDQGTYVAKELVYAYAMWISATFHLTVIRLYDAQVAAPAADPLAALNDPTALRSLLLGYSEKVIALETKVEAQAPKVAALDRIATHTQGSMSVREASKNLQMQPKALTQWLSERRWIYRHPLSRTWLGYQPRIQQGMLEHKVVAGERADGTEWGSTQVRVTAKGLARLAELLEQESVAA